MSEVLKQIINEAIVEANKEAHNHKCHCENNNTKCSCEDFVYEYQGTEEVEFIDKAIAGAKPHTIIHWKDDTDTYAIQQDEGEFDYELGMLICIAKKFCRGIQIDTIYDITKNTEAVKTILKQMIKMTAGYEAIEDMYFVIKDYKEMQAYQEAQERKKQKRIEKLKKQGLYVSKEDYEKAVYENEKLKKELAKQNRKDKYNNLLKENEEMRKQLNNTKSTKIGPFSF